jgi:hypothetical protein
MMGQTIQAVVVEGVGGRPVPSPSGSRADETTTTLTGMTHQPASAL